MVLGRLIQRLTGRQSRSMALDTPEVIYAIGDVHGKLHSLETLLTKVCVDLTSLATDRPSHLVFLGDYIDRGEDSSGVLNYLSTLSATNTTPFDRLTFLRGNHEELMTRFLENPEHDDWLTFGGLETLISYGVPDLLQYMQVEDKTEMVAVCLECIPNRHLDFLYHKLEASYTSGDVFFCHAGVNPDVPISQQKDQTLMWGHPEFMERGGPDGHTIVHGHRIRRSPDIGPNRLGVDTGAYHTGILSAVRIYDNDFKFIKTEP